MARILREVVSLLNRLVQLEHGTVQACVAARERVVDADDRARLGAMIADHRRHVDDLSNVVRNLGGEPSSQSDLRQVFVRGRVALGALVGDSAVLEAVWSGEAAMVSAYEQAASQPGVPVDVVKVLERHLAEERAHHARIAERVKRPVRASSR
jgi:uncharacterized protein (TIGR02284 family)